MVPDYDVVCDVGPDHDEAVGSDDCGSGPDCCSAVDGDMLSDGVVASDLESGWFVAVCSVLRCTSDDGERVDGVVAADFRGTFNDDVGCQLGIGTDFD